MIDRSLKQRLLAAIAVAAAALAPASAYAQYTVYDPTQAANMASQIAKAQQQIEYLRNTYETVMEQVAEAKRAADAVSGIRNVADVFNDPYIRQYLPQDLKKVYDRAQVGGYKGITGTVDEVLASESLVGKTVAEQQQAILDRRRRAAATGRVIGDDAYAGAERRLQQLDKLLGQINTTQDAKAAADLQSRIAVEQAAIHNEAVKLQLLQYMAQAEERLAKEQRKAASDAITSRHNTGMSSIRKAGN